jgi:nucleolar protein 53
MYKKQIVKAETAVKKKQDTRSEKQEQKKFEPRRIARKKFEEEDIQVEENVEALGNLRKVKPLGSILVDRFKSMQKRNILVPNVKRMPRKRRITKIIKKSHKQTDEQPISQKKKKGRKGSDTTAIKIHD